HLMFCAPARGRYRVGTRRRAPQRRPRSRLRGDRSVVIQEHRCHFRPAAPVADRSVQPVQSSALQPTRKYDRHSQFRKDYVGCRRAGDSTRDQVPLLTGKTMPSITPRIPIVLVVAAAGLTTAAAPRVSSAIYGRQAASTSTNMTLTAVEGVKVGHFTLRERPTGCTVVLVKDGTTGGVDVRGGAPGTRETDLLNPVNHVQIVNAITLSGGTAFGLDAASGVMRWLDEHHIGYPVGAAGVVPIVPAAILFDLPFGGNPRIRPTPDCGSRAAEP